MVKADSFTFSRDKNGFQDAVSSWSHFTTCAFALRGVWDHTFLHSIWTIWSDTILTLYMNHLVWYSWNWICVWLWQPPFADPVCRCRPFQMKAFWAAELALWRLSPRWDLSLPSEHGRDPQRRHTCPWFPLPPTSTKCAPKKVCMCQLNSHLLFDICFGHDLSRRQQQWLWTSLVWTLLIYTMAVSPCNVWMEFWCQCETSFYR